MLHKTVKEIPSVQAETVDIAAVKRKTSSLIAEICESLTSRLPTKPQSIVLTGSFARDEGSVLATSNRFRVLGDMEFMVVFPLGVDRGPLQESLDQHAERLKRELSSRGVDCDLEFRAITSEYFRALRPHIFGYELLAHGRTVWGDATFLSAIPKFPRRAIPKWDAWRMLNNRIVEQLEWIGQITSYSPDKLLYIYYQLIKCHIDLATSLLVFAERYEDTYAARSRAFAEWAAEEDSHKEVKFLRLLAQRVTACTAFKLNPNSAAIPLSVRVSALDHEDFRGDLRQALIDLVPLVRETWRWEAEALAHNANSPELTDASLQSAVLRMQPMGEKCRGWAKLLNMPTVRQEPGFWGRFVRLAFQGSPRYLVYGVAAQLFFQLPSALSNGGATDAAADLDWQLPVRFAGNECQRGPWWRLREDVMKSWRLFLRTHLA